MLRNKFLVGICLIKGTGIEERVSDHVGNRLHSLKDDLMITNVSFYPYLYLLYGPNFICCEGQTCESCNIIVKQYNINEAALPNFG